MNESDWTLLKLLAIVNSINLAPLGKSTTPCFRSRGGVRVVVCVLLLLTLGVMRMDDVAAFTVTTVTPNPASFATAHANKKKKKQTTGHSLFLVPSQVVSSRIPSSLGLVHEEEFYVADDASTHQTEIKASPATDITTKLPTKSSRRSRRRKRPSKKKDANKENNRNHVFDELATTGNLPDPWYRAIPMEHLRHHPRFVPLPSVVHELHAMEDVAMFRQESWQWEALHTGRCTTSQAAAALGFLDPTPGQVLNIPNSWRKGAHKAYQRLSPHQQHPVLRTLQDMQQVLLLDDKDKGGTVPRNNGNDSVEMTVNQTIWEETGGNRIGENGNVSFVAEYSYEPSSQEFQYRRRYIKERAGGEYLVNGIRLIWGNTQEATSVLTALNYFAKKDPTVTLKEIGMCGAGLALNQTTANQSSSLLIGATPDAVLCYGDGRIEALEVKNHCPFFSNRNRKRRGGRLKAFSIGDRPLGDIGVMAQYVPQLQMEMYCLGPNCQSAVMVRQTATQGAVILRMMRDDKWIDEMLYFLHCFQKDYVEARNPPRPDFFWYGSEASRYRRFVHRTIEVRDSVKVVAKLPNESIQRGCASVPFFLD